MIRYLNYRGSVHVADLPRALGPSMTGHYWEPISHLYDPVLHSTKMKFRRIEKEDVQ